MRKFVITLLILSVCLIAACSPETTNEEKRKDGNVLLTVFPDPNLAAGKPYGYLFHFTEAFTKYKGKRLAINAYHHETGEQIKPVASEIIIEPPPGYSSLERFTATFEVPYSGFWRYEVTLDGEFYAEVAVFVGEKKMDKSIIEMVRID